MAAIKFTASGGNWTIELDDNDWTSLTINGGPNVWAGRPQSYGPYSGVVAVQATYAAGLPIANQPPPYVFLGGENVYSVTQWWVFNAGSTTGNFTLGSAALGSAVPTPASQFTSSPQLIGQASLTGEIVIS